MKIYETLQTSTSVLAFHVENTLARSTFEMCCIKIHKLQVLKLENL